MNIPITRTEMVSRLLGQQPIKYVGLLSVYIDVLAYMCVCLCVYVHACA